MDKQFTMSMYMNKEELYKAKAEYYRDKCKAMEWISVEDELPKDVECLITDGAFIYMPTGIDGRRFYDDEGYFNNITHWMPLPEPPKGNNDE